MQEMDKSETRTFDDGVGDSGVVAVVTVDSAHPHHLRAGWLLLADTDDVLLRVHEVGRVVVHVGDSHAHRHTSTARWATLVSGLRDQFVHVLRLPVQWHSR